MRSATTIRIRLDEDRTAVCRLHVVETCEVDPAGPHIQREPAASEMPEIAAAMVRRDYDFQLAAPPTPAAHA